MLFRDLLLSIDDESLLPPGRTINDFHTCCYHVIESFFVYLSCELDGQHFLPHASKVAAMLVDERNRSNYGCSESVAHYPVRGTDLHWFFAASEVEQDAWLLETLSNAIRQVAIQQGVSADPVAAAVSRAKAEGLLLEYPVRKLCKVHRSRKFRFDVLRRIRRGDEQWLLKVSDSSGKRLAEISIAESTFAVIAAARYHSSRWRSDVFQILDRRKRVKFRRSAKQFERLLD